MPPGAKSWPLEAFFCLAIGKVGRTPELARVTDRGFVVVLTIKCERISVKSCDIP
jgi:hypothetical protein